MSSFWTESTPTTNYPQLEGDVDVDVAVIGAGITGVTSAYLLKQAGKRVALVDLKKVARGASGYTTAKITSGHNLIYASLEKTFGTGGARTYAQANEAGLAKIREIIEALALDCDLETKANYAYAEKADFRAEVESEVAAAKRAGLAAAFVRETPLPFPVAGAIRIEDQAQFHPRSTCCRWSRGSMATAAMFSRTHESAMSATAPQLSWRQTAAPFGLRASSSRLISRSKTKASSLQKRIRSVRMPWRQRSTPVRHPTACSSASIRRPARCEPRSTVEASC